MAPRHVLPAQCVPLHVFWYIEQGGKQTCRAPNAVIGGREPWACCPHPSSPPTTSFTGWALILGPVLSVTKMQLLPRPKLRSIVRHNTFPPPSPPGRFLPSLSLFPPSKHCPRPSPMRKRETGQRGLEGLLPLVCIGNNRETKKKNKPHGPTSG